jgi:hypothetical protein|tara:strand:+ start:68 stop:412 length:345 start_codon:yes stop_codon:yes gene_type:complete
MKKYRTKGTRVEREYKNMFKRWGFDCFKTPLSGATGIPGLTGDLVLTLDSDTKFSIECKARKNPPKVIEGWLKNNDILLIKGDYIQVDSSTAIMSVSTLRVLLNKFLEEENNKS